MRVLVAEDNEVVGQAVARALTADRHAVDVVAEGTDALWMAREFGYDLIILDISIPPPDGIEVCRTLRAEGVWTPILLLTGKGGVEDRVLGLDAGADDYVLKPFSPEELLARVRALGRRTPVERPSVIEAGGVVLDPGARTVEIRGSPVELSRREFALLELLMRHVGQTMTRADIEEKLWDFAFAGTSNVVDSLVRRLREKIDPPGAPSLIETVRGHGYRFGGTQSS